MNINTEERNGFVTVEVIHERWLEENQIRYLDLASDNQIERGGSPAIRIPYFDKENKPLLEASGKPYSRFARQKSPSHFEYWSEADTAAHLYSPWNQVTDFPPLDMHFLFGEFDCLALTDIEQDFATRAAALPDSFGLHSTSQKVQVSLEQEIVACLAKARSRRVFLIGDTRMIWQHQLYSAAFPNSNARLTAAPAAKVNL